MNRQSYRWDIKSREQRSHEVFREIGQAESAYYDGDAICTEYSKAIFDFLRDPASLEMVGGSGSANDQKQNL